MKALLIAVALMTGATLVHAGEPKGTDIKTGMAKDAKTATHVAKGTVKSVDARAGTVTLHHEPVKSLKWPEMTMSFKVQDKALMDKLGAGKKVEFEFEQRGKDYVITDAK